MPDIRKLVWRADARRDLRNILNYIGDRNPPAAERMRQRLEFVANRLVEFPLMHRSGRLSDTREAVAHPNYIIIYRVSPKLIEILNIVHAAQNYP